MEFAFSPEQETLRRELRNFLHRECQLDYVRACDEAQRFPVELYEKMGAQGWFGLPFPKEYGGGGGDAVDLAILLEEVGYAFCDFANTGVRLTAISGMQIYRFGNEAQKQFYLRRISEGKCHIAFGVSEPEAGSDIANLKTTAIRDGDFFIVEGDKAYATGSDVADYVIIAARTDPGSERHRGISLFIVDLRSEGIVKRRIATMGVRATATVDLTFNRVKVPAENLIGEINRGWYQMLAGIEMERYAVAALCAGAAQAALDIARDYTTKRVQFGQPISKFQAVRHKFANMQMDIDIARLHAYRVAWMVKENIPCVREASLAKLHATEAFSRVTHDALQVTGGYGYRMESHLQRLFRDAKMYEIGGGPSEVQRDIIARRLGLP